jgi:hypothetical protein
MRTRATAMLLSTGLLLTACGPDIPLDLNVRSVAVTVPRLITPAIEYVELPELPPPVSLPPPPPVRVVSPPPPAPPAPTPTPTPEPPLPPACPAAGPFDVPDLPATLIVDTIPAEATFEQQSELTYGSTSEEAPAGALANPVEVVVTALESSTSSVGQQLDAWSVHRTDAESGATSVEVYRLVHPHDSPLATDPGIYLTGMGWQDEVRGEMVFEAAGPGLWLLPSPAVFAAEDGVQYVGSATDPDTLTTLAIVRNVTGRKRVDACGDLIEAMTVSMTGTLTTDSAQYQVDWAIQFATSYGGLDVEQTLALTSPGEGFSWIRTTRNVALPEVPA